MPFEPSIVDKRQIQIAWDSRAGTGTFEKILHPRHTRAYSSFLDFVSWERIDGKIHAVFNEKAFQSAPLVDDDGNTFFSRFLMSHIVLEEPYRSALYQELKGQKLIDYRSNKFGQTPLMLAIESGWTDVVEDILATNPDCLAKDRAGRTAADYVRFTAPVAITRSNTAKPNYSIDAIAKTLRPRLSVDQQVRLDYADKHWMPTRDWMLLDGCGNQPDPNEPPSEYRVTWPPPNGIFKKGG